MLNYIKYTENLTEVPKEMSQIQFTLVRCSGFEPALTQLHLFTSKWVVNVD